TGYCGAVTCAHGLCPKEFTQQWSALLQTGAAAPVGLLTLHRELSRARKEYGEDAGWISRSVAYVDHVLPQHGGAIFPHRKLWLIVQGTNRDEELAARRIAAQTGAGTVVVARTKIDQSYEPRISSLK